MDNQKMVAWVLPNLVLAPVSQLMAVPSHLSGRGTDAFQSRLNAQYNMVKLLMAWWGCWGQGGQVVMALCISMCYYSMQSHSPNMELEQPWGRAKLCQPQAALRGRNWSWSLVRLNPCLPYCPTQEGISGLYNLLGSSSYKWINWPQLMLIARGRAAVMCREQGTTAYLTDSSTELTLGGRLSLKSAHFCLKLIPSLPSVSCCSCVSQQYPSPADEDGITTAQSKASCLPSAVSVLHPRPSRLMWNKNSIRLVLLKLLEPIVQQTEAEGVGWP